MTAVRVRDEIAYAQRRFAWSALLALSALIAVVPPAIRLLGMPVAQQGGLALSTRLIVSALALAVVALLWLRPALRRWAALAIVVEATAALALFGVSLVDSGLDPIAVCRYVTAVYAVTLAAVTVRDVIAIFFTAFGSFVWYASAHGALAAPAAGWVISTLLISFLMAIAISALTVTTRRRELVTRVRVALEQEEQMARLRTRDAVTGLPNVARFGELCADALCTASARGARFAIAALDLDHFRRVVSQFGHATADLTLAEVGRRFEAAAPAAIVCRGHGDAFFALIPAPAARRDAEQLVSAMLESLGRPFAFGRMHLTASVGLAVYPDDARTVDALIDRAETALLRAARAPGSVAAVDDDGRAARRRRLRDDLPAAIASGELVMHYQPYVDASSAQLVGAEALARWQHPEFGLLQPAEFIDLAESEDLMGALGDWAMREATAQCRRWWDAGLEIGVSFNVSLTQFRDAALFERLRSAVNASGVMPSAVTLEITESAAMEDFDRTLRVMRACTELGVGIALDDFGTGYSSLARLKHLPLTAIKIDRLFVNGLPRDADGAVVARAIIALAHNLGFDVCSEGVETQEQAAWLRAEGCDVLQG
ncbi:MAG TPA: bifunctional diguanylate cyclase/phosphodiesterase, partial [Candidatus Elarobacter sp.]